jgi:hypothetical protein
LGSADDLGLPKKGNQIWKGSFDSQLRGQMADENVELNNDYNNLEKFPSRNAIDVLRDYMGKFLDLEEVPGFVPKELENVSSL